MIGFTIKKWFFDFWDNFIAISLLNIGYIVLVVMPLSGALTLMETNLVLSLVVFALVIVLATVYTGAVSYICSRIAKYEKVEFKDIIIGLKETWKHALLLALFNMIFAAIIFFVVPFYLVMGNVLALAALIFLMWLAIFWLVVSQYYFPIFLQLEKNPRKLLRKAMIIFFDNTAFSLVLLVFGIIVLGLSVISAFLVLGPASLALLQQVGLKLRLPKYDYLEENPGANRKKIPWRVIHMDDQERVGKRTLRGMIFPWKD